MGFFMLMKQVVMVFALPLLGVAHAQTCKPNSIPATTPSSQFADNHDGTVTDNKTGLMWKRCSEGQTWDSGVDDCNGNAVTYTWQSGLQQAQTVNTSGGFAGYSDWRLPNITELESIVEEQCYRPAINLTVFPNTSSSYPSSHFWSSSPIAYNVAYNGNTAWLVSDDGLSGAGGMNGSFGVRLVRGGQ